MITSSLVDWAETKEQFTEVAYKNAAIVQSEWQPLTGYRSNRDILHKLYYYYQQLYFRNPQRFLWAGLARLTGGQVLFGMNNLVKIAKDPCVLTQNIVAVAKEIFENMAWQHELFLADKNLLCSTCEQIHLIHPSVYSFADCWQMADSDDAAQVSRANKMLLKNEQLNTIQPYYDKIYSDKYSARYFRFTRFVMRNIHPHHGRFIFCHPLGDVTQFTDRWQWIDSSKGMWQTWADCGLEERNRLVGLSNEDVVRHRW